MAGTPEPAEPAHAKTPPPPFAAFLHPNYRVVDVLDTPLAGRDQPNLVVVRSSGPGLQPDQPVPGGTEDVQMLRFDPIAKRWNLVFDAASKVLSPAFLGSVSGESPEPEPLFPQDHPIGSTAAVAATVADTKPVLVLYGVDSYYNHPPGLVAVLSISGTGTPTITYFDSAMGMSAPTITGAPGEQRISITASYVTPADPFCCPVRTYTQVLGTDDPTDGTSVSVLSDDRPWLGAYIATDPQSASAAVVVGTAERSPASSALHVADRLLGVVGATAPDNLIGPEVIDELAVHLPGDRVTLQILRHGVRLEIPVVLASRHGALTDEWAVPKPAVVGVLGGDAPAGGPPGAVVHGTQPGSAAAAAGLRDGDLITAAGPVIVRGVVDLQAALVGAIGRVVELRVQHRDGTSSTIAVGGQAPRKDDYSVLSVDAV